MKMILEICKNFQNVMLIMVLRNYLRRFGKYGGDNNKNIDREYLIV
jgi:hypothetical protein